jgi:hypothetical protein
LVEATYPKLISCHAAARLSGSKSKAVKELDAATSKEDGTVASTLNRTKRWLLSHSQHLNFFSILILASVSPLSAILCYQFLQCGYLKTIFVLLSI